MGFAVLICRKSLQHKHLRRAWRARLALSPLAARVYVQCCLRILRFAKTSNAKQAIPSVQLSTEHPNSVA
jgi:hypothetical protein